MSPPSFLTLVKSFVSQVVKEHKFVADVPVMQQLAHELAKRMDLQSTDVKKDKTGGYVIKHAGKGVSVLMIRESAIVKILYESPKKNENWQIQLPQVVKTNEAGPSKATKKY